ncbi:uncharacterized protein [Pleurodeles waltl]|uniref:uncharacterized protein isoform X2 n=1 Tax=Pleurodeles waltl TaxID=8319 RepID=UPI003709B624
MKVCKEQECQRRGICSQILCLESSHQYPWNKETKADHTQNMTETTEAEAATSKHVEMEDSTVATPMPINPTSNTRRAIIAPLPGFVEGDEEQPQNRTTTTFVGRTQTL